MRKAAVNKLVELAKRDRDIILLTGDLGFSVFEEFKERFPNQYLNVGLSEQCMIGMAAGLLLEGKKVFVYSIIPFLIYRPFEHIRNDLCYQKLPVKLLGVGSGIVYGGQGGTHHSIEDIAITTSLPDMMVFAPGDPLEVEKIIENSLHFDLPCYIRLNRSGDPFINTAETIRSFEIGKPLRVRGNENTKICILTIGNTLPLAVEIFDDFCNKGIDCSVYSVHTLKPVNNEVFKDIFKNSEVIVIIEEHISRNGLCCLVSAIMRQFENKILHFCLGEGFIHQVGNQNYLRKSNNLTKDSIISRILNYYSRL